MTKQGWHREDIKAAVRRTGKSLSDLSRDKNLPDHACRAALLGRHRAAEIAIAEYLSVPLWELWPGRWRRPRRDGDAAIRIDHRRTRKSRTAAPARHRQKSQETLT
ncbi:putative transcriptional regulator, Nlp [Magnetospirillum sp. XM-1]|uniref:helix-turn-helix domain-containing protein n=1 Tax=Magnetospirillum sp. XM-1 TaxID=1663591 RepID=UPI00073DCB9B|nr:putative transcriptional regulator, Nlp [Magnetospirillum sp. XM-1]